MCAAADLLTDPVLRTVTLAERPDLLEAMWALPSTWPPFVLQDPVGARLFDAAVQRSPELQVLVLDDDESVVARLVATPFAWSGQDEDLPARGWDAVLEQSTVDADRGTAPTAVSLLEARVHPDLQGRGLSSRLLGAGWENVRRLGFRDLVAPVRPTGKSAEPRTPMSDCVARRRDDGLPQDPWVRVHVRAGARVVGVCPASMTVPGTLSQWRAWTGLPLEVSGDVEVEGALVPVHVDVEQDHAVYVEPNLPRVPRRTTTARHRQRYALTPFAVALGWVIGGLLQGESLATAADDALLPGAAASLLAAALWWASPRRRQQPTSDVDDRGAQ